jgi:hypothetical protein
LPLEYGPVIESPSGAGVGWSGFTNTGVCVREHPKPRNSIINRIETGRNEADSIAPEARGDMVTSNAGLDAQPERGLHAKSTVAPPVTTAERLRQ